jgi:hypothetical protein
VQIYLRSKEENMTIPLKDYRKAHYKMGVRNKVEVNFSKLNPRIAKYLFNNHHEKYLAIYGDTFKPLVEEINSNISLGVINYGENIVGVFTTDGSGEFLGNIDNLILTRKIEDTMKLYNVSR